MVAWWKGDGDAHDEVGGNNGADVANVSYATGKNGDAFNFDGASYVQVPDSDSLDFTNHMTVEAWINLRTYSGVNSREIVSKVGGPYLNQASWTFAINPTTQKAYFIVSASNHTAGIVYSTTSIPTNEWVHLAGVYDGTAVRIYVNGQLDASVPWALPPMAGSNPVVIGCTLQNYSSPTSFFNGLIDEVSLYDRALGSNEIAAIYEADSAGKCTPQPPCDLPDGIVSWWKLDGNGVDSVSTSDGTLFGQPTFALGKVGDAMVFDGSNDHVKVAASPGLNVGNGPGMTIEGWIKPTTVSEQKPLLEWNNNVGAIGAHFWISVASHGGGSGSLWVNLMDTNGVAHQLSTAPGLVLPNLYQHVAMAYDKSTGETAVYLNGVMAAHTNLGSFVPDTRSDLYLGYRSSGTAAGTRYIGAMDEVSIYGRALGAHEIAAIHEAGAAGKCLLEPPTCVLPEGIVAWWKGEGDAVDSIGTADGTLTGETLFETGKVGEAFVFDSYADGVDLGNPTSLQLQNLTIEGWIKRGSAATVSSLPGRNANLFGGGWGCYLFWLDANGNMKFDRLGDVAPPPGPLVSGTNYHHVAVTKSGSNLVYYLDGVAYPTAPITSTFTFTTTIGLGFNPSDRNHNFFGAIDELSVYNRALSSNEIAAIYQADSAGKCVPEPPVCELPQGIVSWWKAEDNGLDSVGTNGVTLSGGAGYSDGKVGRAFDFDGVSGFARAEASPSLNVGVGPGFTVEGWINPADTANGHPIIEWNGGAGFNFGVHLWLGHPNAAPGYLFANIVSQTGVGKVIDTAPGVITNGVYQHVALTYDKGSGIARLLVNGAVAKESNLGSFTPQTSYPVYLGRRPPGDVNSRLFVGSIDELSVYDRALNVDEIAAIVAAGAAGKCDVLQPPVITNQPVGQVAVVGDQVKFDVGAEGASPLAYQWFHDGDAIAGADEPGLTLSNVQTSDAGVYHVVITNLAGATTSSPVSLTVTVPICTPAPDGLVAWWAAEDNGLDSKGTNVAQLAAGAGYSPGKVGRAFSFDGTNGFARAEASPALNVGLADGFTVEGWINPSDTASGHPIIEWNGGSGADFGVHLWLGHPNFGPGYLFANIVSQSGEWKVIDTAPGVVANGVFQHVALTYDKTSGVARLMVNGVVVKEMNLGSFTPQTSYPVYIGRRPPGDVNSRLFAGLIDELSIYNRALGTNEITDIYAAGTAGKCPPPVCTPAPDGMVSWWQGEGSSLDSVGSHDGTLLGGVDFVDGKVGKAFGFNGVDGAMDAGSWFDYQTFTLSMWVNPGASQVQYADILDNFHNERSNWVLQQNALKQNEYYFAVPLNGAVGTTYSRFTLASNTWQHLVITRDTNNHNRVYVNGALVAEAQDSGPVNYTNQFFRVGAHASNVRHWKGKLDELVVFDRALTTNEIASIYAAGGAGLCPLPPVIVAVNPAEAFVNEGGDVEFEVVAAGSPPLGYQWQFEGDDLTGATNAFLGLSEVAFNQMGQYSVIVSGPGGVAGTNVVLMVNRLPLADAGRTETLLISPNGSNAVAILDGSLSSDPDGDALGYEWFLTGGVVPIANGVVAITTLPLGTNALTLTVSDGMASASQDFAIEVITTSEALDRLTQLVQDGAGNPQPLAASLRAALAAIDRSQPEVAINQLEAFKNKVLAQVMPVDPELAEQLLAAAQEIIDALNGGVEEEVALQITSIRKGDSGKPQLSIHGRANRKHVVEVSTNLVDWTPIGVAAACGECEYSYEDTESPTTAVRYYRVVSPK